MFTTLLALLLQLPASAQYYSWGTDPLGLKWMRSKTPHAKVIYPRSAEKIGHSTLYYADVLYPHISYGYRLPALNIPFVVHPENMKSNGLVMWLPKRVEFLSSPSIDGYSMPWIKQLVAHEYRHAAQYNNLNVGFVKFLSYLLGQQSSTIGLIFMPLWMMEGDATMFETQASSFGRGLQPRFTLEYRAMGRVDYRYNTYDKFFCGSYRDFIPDHYQLGYQMVAHGNELAGRVMADDMAAYGPRHPWSFISENRRMRRLFGFSSRELFRSTFDHLNNHWESLEPVANSSQMLSTPRIKSYTTYSHPQWIDGEGILLLKEDMDSPSRFVMLDEQTGHEQRLSYTGNIATRPIYDPATRRVWWTEYRRSKMFAERVRSTLCYMDIDKQRPRSIDRRRNILYPTPDDEGGLAWIEYDPSGIYSVVYRNAAGDERKADIPFGQEIHSLAWDSATRLHYCIVTGDEGMWIASIDKSLSLATVTRPAYITISNLRAAGGRLYYGSIASGRDEIHCYDLASGVEYQLTTSRYGSFDVAPADKGRILLTSYDSLGYHPAVQREDKLMRRVEYAALPKSVVNPPREKWDIINLDTIPLMQADTATIASPTKTRRYRKGLTLFNFHSWAPLSYDPFELSEESAISMNLGATVMTQNLLSSMQGFFTYGYNAQEGNIWKGTLRYYGLGPTISVNATYGGRQNIYPIYVYNSETHRFDFPLPPKRGKYYSVGVDFTVPLMFQNGYHTQRLVAAASWNYSNGLVANTGTLSFDEGGISNVATIGYQEGLHLTSFSLGFQDMVRMAHRDFTPPWGVALQGAYAINPTNKGFSDLLALYGKVLTPGFFKHNSLSLAMAYQTSIGGFKSSDALSALSFKSTNLLVRGFSSSQIENHNYMALSLNYQLPICYPDGGIRGIVYFKRIRLNVGGDVARFQRTVLDPDAGLKYRWHNIHAYGGDIIVDVNIFSSPAAATSAFKLSLYRPSEGNFYIGAGVELPF
ncbi:MAG: hypothetical protein IKY82_06900 [Alistipes sp.]|nr:hypothetical protein [Alistipes sp.]